MKWKLRDNFNMNMEDNFIFNFLTLLVLPFYKHGAVIFVSPVSIKI